MRFSIAIDTKNRPVPDSFGQVRDWATPEGREAFPEVRLVRLPRRIAKYLRSNMTDLDRWNSDHVQYHARYNLQETRVSRLLSQADSFLPQLRTFRQRAPRPWRVGDPCYVNGEGHGNLLFIQQIEGAGTMIVDGSRESAYKVYRPTFHELVRHLERAQEGLARITPAVNAWTPKQRREASGRAKRELEEMLRQHRVWLKEVQVLQNYLTS